MTVRRLGIVTPSVGTDTELVTFTDNYLVSVIATNTSTSSPADVRIWVEPSGSSTAAEYSYIAYDIEINVGNALETHRFAVNSGDTLMVRSTTADISFTASGIPQTQLIGYAGEVDYLDFNTSATPTIIEGRLAWNSDENTLDLGLGGGVVAQLGEEFFVPKVLNDSGVEIPNGAFVMATGAQGDQITIAKAVTDGSVEPEYMLGVATQTIAIGQDDGRVTTNGIVRDVNTDGWIVGTVLYPDPATPGGWTDTKPDAPNIRTPVAIVLREHENTGRIYVRMTLGQHLDHDIEDVQIDSPQDGQALTYEASTGLWKNTSIDALPDQTGNSGEFLTTDGTNASWASVDALPSQTGNDGKYLTTDGTDASWADISGAVYSDTEPSSPTVGQLWIESDVDVSAYSVYQRWTRVLTGSEDTFTGLEGTSILNYPAGLEQVYLNGVLLVRGTDYTATNGTSVVLTSAGQSGDVIEILSPNTFSSASYYTKSEIDLLLTEIDGGGVSETYTVSFDGGTP